MKTVTEATDLRTAAAALLEQLRKLCAEINTASHDKRPLRFEISVAAADPLRWLESCPGADKLYWRGRADTTEIAGLGVADSVRLTTNSSHAAIDALATRLQDAESGPRFFGGHRFDPLEPPETASSAWKTLGLGRFILPAVTLTRTDGGTRLAVNCLASPTSIDAARQALESLSQNSTSAPATMLPDIVGREDAPEYEGWQKNIAAALAAIETGRCEKIVLARRTRLTLSGSLDPWCLLRLLRDKSQQTCLFGFQTDGGPAFVGATPERLYRRTGRTLESEAVAGTRPRGATATIDHALAHELQTSEKDTREHAFVVRSLRAHLTTVCSDLQVDPEPQVIKLSQLQHLRTHISGTLREGIIDGRLLSLMHPTPAVNGYPRSAALNLIRELEPFDRGWYTGPIGWIGRDEAEFAVAIRSALVTERGLTLFSGAGIVRGSEASREWAEIEHKIALYTMAFDGREL